MKILYVTPYVPTPIRTRPYYMLQALARLGHQLTVLSAGGSSTQERQRLKLVKGVGQFRRCAIHAGRSKRVRIIL